VEINYHSYGEGHDVRGRETKALTRCGNIGMVWKP